MPANNIHTPVYTAADLHRYATGSMTAPEMYALEKAALEDPFLAEALDGFIEATASQPQPVLQKAIDRVSGFPDKKENRKVVPLWRKRMVQIAVAAAVVMGAAWWIFSLLTPQNKNEQNVFVSKQETVPAATADSTAAFKRTTTDANSKNQLALADTEHSAMLAQTEQKPAPAKPTYTQPGSVKTDSTTYRQETAAASAPVSMAEPANAPVTTEMKEVRGRVAKADTNLYADNPATQKDSDGRSDKFFAGPGKNAQQYFFKGKLTDEKNNPLPYASVMLTGENIGTYTDANGEFNFIYEDTLLPVRTRSVGYISQNSTLKPGNKETQIVMKEDDKLNQNLALTVQPLQRKMFRYKKTIVEEDSLETVAVQPSVGMMDYNLYLLNNNRISELPQMNRQVKLSFEVDAKGDIQNITVDQSSGKALDDEAIRLLKQGPKWKIKKGNSGKGKITIKF